MTGPEASLPEKVVALDEALLANRIPHAFGGALALAYYAEPRATIDIDLNIFLSPSEQARVAKALGPLEVELDTPAALLERDGQCRIWWGRTPLDLFFSSLAFHAAMRDAVRSVPFGDAEIPILAPEHLVVCKASFDRPKDWLDIEQVLVCADRLDTEGVETWLATLLGTDDRRLARFHELAERYGTTG